MHLFIQKDTFLHIFLTKSLVDSKKSSTFAPTFGDVSPRPLQRSWDFWRCLCDALKVSRTRASVYKDVYIRI